MLLKLTLNFERFGTGTQRRAPSRPRAVIAFRVTCIAGLLVGAVSTAQADIDWSSSDWGGYSPDALNYWNLRDSQARKVKGAPASGNTKGQRSSERSVLDASNTFASGDRFSDVRGIEQLAAQGDHRGGDYVRRKSYYHKIIWSFDQTVERLYGVPHSNLATGMTALLAGGYAAYSGKSFPDAWVKPLYRQAEQLMANNPRIQSATLRDKAAMFQVMTGIGVELQLVQHELAKTPDASKQRMLRDAGAQILQTVLGANPDRVVFSSDGFEVR